MIGLLGTGVLCIHSHHNLVIKDRAPTQQYALIAFAASAIRAVVTNTGVKILMAALFNVIHAVHHHFSTRFIQLRFDIISTQSTRERKGAGMQTTVPMLCGLYGGDVIAVLSFLLNFDV